MQIRIVRLENGFWRIRTDDGELPAKEQDDLKAYFDEIEMPYQIESGRLRVLDRVTSAEILEKVTHFYDGVAEVYPF